MGRWRPFSTADRLLISAGEAGYCGTWSFNTTITRWLTLRDSALASAAPSDLRLTAGAADADNGTNGPMASSTAAVPVPHATFDFRTGCPSLHRSHRHRFHRMESLSSKTDVRRQARKTLSELG
jgi:hypothetical protein